MYALAPAIGVILAAIIGSSVPTQVQAETTLTEALFSGKLFVRSRYRFEHVGQDGLPEDAAASTLGTRAGYQSGSFKEFSFLFDIENVAVIGAEKYNDTINGRTEYPVVADPDTTELNQAYLNFAGIPDTELRLGRQRIIYDNQRFIGAVGFRQNEQTFDAFAVSHALTPNAHLRYTYIDKVLRIFGDDSPVGEFDSDSHVLHARYDGWQQGSLTGYGYLLDLEDAPELSSSTFGVRFAGSRALSSNDEINITYTGEFAHQYDYGDNPADVSLSYGLIETGLSYRDFQVQFGYEVLAGDGVESFQTPLATLHVFNGVTDKFLTTPPDGLEDLYLKLGWTRNDVSYVEQLSLSGAVHYFSAEDSSADYGYEWSVKLAAKLSKHWLLSAEYADYDADDFATDTEKAWLTAQFSY